MEVVVLEARILKDVVSSLPRTKRIIAPIQLGEYSIAKEIGLAVEPRNLRRPENRLDGREPAVRTRSGVHCEETGPSPDLQVPAERGRCRGVDCRILQPVVRADLWRIGARTVVRKAAIVSIRRVQVKGQNPGGQPGQSQLSLEFAVVPGRDLGGSLYAKCAAPQVVA